MNPTKCLWCCESYCRSAFFRPPAHLCAFTNITEILLNVMLSYQLNQTKLNQLEAQGPFIAHLITNSKQFSQKKDNQNDSIQINMSTVSSAIHQYVAVNIWSEGGFRQRRSPSFTFFLPALDPPLGISDRNPATRMAAFQVKPFVFEALFDSFLPCRGSTPGRI